MTTTLFQSISNTMRQATQTLDNISAGFSYKKMELRLIDALNQDDPDTFIYWLRKISAPSSIGALSIPLMDSNLSETETSSMKLFVQKWIVRYSPADTAHNENLLNRTLGHFPTGWLHANGRGPKRTLEVLADTLSRGFSTDVVSLCWHQRLPRVLNALAKHRLFSKNDCFRFANEVVLSPANSISMQDLTLLDAVLSCPSYGPLFIAQPHLQSLWMDDTKTNVSGIYPLIDAWPPNCSFAFPFYMQPKVQWLIRRMLAPSHTFFPTMGMADACIQSLIAHQWLSPEDVIEAQRLTSEAFEKYHHSHNSLQTSNSLSAVGVFKTNPITGKTSKDEVSKDVIGWCENQILLRSSQTLQPLSNEDRVEQTSSFAKRRSAL